MCVLKYINVDTFVGKMWVVWWMELYLNLHFILIQQSHPIVEEG
jgi:tellurite resistance protein TehA-like permease